MCGIISRPDSVVGVGKLTSLLVFDLTNLARVLIIQNQTLILG